MKKIMTLVLGLMLSMSLAVPAFAMDNGAYTANMISDYYNPDTGNIDDGGTANAALGVGMCRSVTGESVLVEKIGDAYFLTVRLLLQSNTKEVAFYNRVGFDSYVPVSYEILAENAVDDSVDYRIQVTDPFAPIKVTMYVTPMGRDVLWYMYADEATLSSATGDFVVTATAEVLANLEQPVVEEVLVEEVAEKVAMEEILEEIEEVEETLEEVEETEAIEEVEEEIVEEEIAEEVSEEVEEAEEEIEEEDSHALSWILGVVLVIGVLLLVFKKRLGGKK